MKAKPKHQLTEHQKHVIRGVIQASLRSGRQDECGLCCDRQFWIDNGFSENERLEFCTLWNCPPCPPGN